MGKDDLQSLIYLLQVTNSTFPIGAFSHSFGFETLVKDGHITDSHSLEEYTQLWLRFGLAPLDGVAVAQAYTASLEGDLEKLAEIDEIVGALKLPRESWKASVDTGSAFLKVTKHIFAGDSLSRYKGAVDEGFCTGHSATVFGVAAADAGVSIEGSVLAYLQSSFSDLLSVVARLIPLGHLDVQKVLARSWECLDNCTLLALSRQLSKIGSNTVFLDLASMRHECLDSRLCIS